MTSDGELLTSSVYLLFCITEWMSEWFVIITSAQTGVLASEADESYGNPPPR